MRSFLYLHTADLAAARGFYSEMLGLDEIVASEEVIGYRIGALQLTIAKHENPPAVEGWSRQLGWEGGTTAVPSWGVEVADDAFGPTVRRLRATPSPAWSSEPVWVGYWSFPVLDPMGNTVEVSAVSRQAWTAANGAS